MVRIFGPEGGWARVRSLLGLFFSLTLLAVFIASPAQAVHNVGVFELDTGPTGANATNDAAAGDDWDNVCHQVTGSDCSTSSDTSGAKAVSWLSEPNRNTTIFTGGGSKDPQDVSNWLWKDGAGGLPDKDNLRHAFAVRYSVPASGVGYGGTDPTPGTNSADDGACPAPTPGPCEVLYFGIDRFDNSGDAQLGFWFFQNEISLGTTSTQGGTTFDGVHAPGDLLILSDFSVGGTTSNINIYEWVTSGGDVSTHLLSLGGGANKDCSTVTANDSFCGIVNKDDPSTPAVDLTVSPWPFTDKSGNHDFLPGELYEGGVNLSSLGLGGECFASFDSESRASTSPTATLKDFVLGGFGRCNSSVASTQSWTPEDSATVSVSGATTWNGTVTFSLFAGTACTGTALYTSDAIPVSNSDATASTNDSTVLGTPSAIDSTGGTFVWQVFFDSTTNRVPDSTTCVEQTDLTIDNDNTAV